MKKINILALFALLAFLALTTQGSYAEPINQEVRKDKGLVIFYREKAFKGGAIRFNLNQGQEPIGALPSGSTLQRYVYPGQHTFWSEAISKDSVTVDVVAGQTYYIKGVVQMGVLAGRPKLSIVPESVAKPAIDKMK